MKAASADQRRSQLPVLVVAPFGRDADVIANSLVRADIPCEVCPDVRSALPKLTEGTGALVVGEEVLTDDLIGDFSLALQRQPAWSDAPVIILSTPCSGSKHVSQLMERMQRPLGHTTLLERPIRPKTLVNTVETALRARHKQYQVRDALEQARASESRYRSLILATSSIVWTTDVHLNAVEVLPSWEAYTGQTFEQYVGRGWEDAIHFGDRDRTRTSIATAMARLRPFQLEYRLRRHDGEYRWVIGRGVPIFREDCTVKEWMGTCTDIQDRKDSEKALRKGERMALAGQLAAGIAHEINNPLEAVGNLIYLISTRSTDAEILGYATLAQRELTRVTEISGQTLRFYKKSTTPVETDLTELLQSLLHLFQTKFARRKLELLTDFQPAACIQAFPNELRQLFANLISNAIDATPPGGKICLSLKPALNWKNGGRGVRVVVADTGSGIASAIRPRIFDPFVTTKGEAGTGLGLWVCDDIVERHGGTLQLKSRTAASSGTVFSIFLPAAHAPVPQSSEFGIVNDAAVQDCA